MWQMCLKYPEKAERPGIAVGKLWLSYLCQTCLRADRLVSPAETFHAETEMGSAAMHEQHAG